MIAEDQVARLELCEKLHTLLPEGMHIASKWVQCPKAAVSVQVWNETDLSDYWTGKQKILAPAYSVAELLGILPAKVRVDKKRVRDLQLRTDYVQVKRRGGRTLRSLLCVRGGPRVRPNVYRNYCRKCSGRNASVSARKQNDQTLKTWG